MTTWPGRPRRPHGRPDAVLHVGMGKTGTTTIQDWLHHHRDALAELGVLYPRSPGERRHTRLGLAVDPDPERQPGDWSHQEEDTPEELRPVLLRGLRAEVEAAGSERVVLSDEALSGARPVGIEELRRLLAELTASVRLVIYLRRQDEHLCSRYQQVIKAGRMVELLADRAPAMEQAPLYDYHARLADWQTLLAPREIAVRRFERARFPGGSLLADFVEAADLPAATTALEEPARRNESLDAASVEFLRLVNLWTRELGGHPPGLPRRRRLVRRLREVSTGPTLVLPADLQERFLGVWEESNRAVARDFFPDGPATLFDLTPRTRDVTSDQRLDPARLEELADVVGLPAAGRVSLRRLAEREARNS